MISKLFKDNTSSLFVSQPLGHNILKKPSQMSHDTSQLKMNA